MKKVLVVAVGLLMCGFVGSVWADVTVKSTIDNQGIGGFMNMQGTQQTMVAGDKSKITSQMKMTNKVVKFLGGGKPQETADIVRLDKEVFWNLNLKDKKYTELTFAEMKAQFEKAQADAQKERAKTEKKSDSIQTSATVDVEVTGKSQTLLGYKADEVIVTMIFEGKDSSSGKSGSLKFVMDSWMAKGVPGYEEYQKYQQSLAEKLGFAGSSKGSMESALRGFGVDPKVIYEKMKGIEGMPLLSVVSIIPEGIDTLKVPAADSSKEAAPAKAEEEQPKDVKDAAMKKLGGLFGKKKKEPKPEETADRGKSQPDKMYLFHLTNTVTEINTSAIPSGEFEVPAGFEKAKK